MKLLKCILTNNPCYKAGRTIAPKGVMVHSTGANNPDLKRYVQPLEGDTDYATLIKQLGENRNRNDWNHTTRQVGVHAFIGKLADGSVAAVQTLPWNHRGWHSGSGKKGSANNTHIGFEICEDGLTDKAYFDKAYQTAVDLTANLCKQFKLDPLADGVVICHAEGHDRGIASNHGDVEHWFPKHGKSMADFRKDVKRAMGKAAFATVLTKKPATQIQVEPAKEGPLAMYAKTWTVTAGAGLKMRRGAGTGKGIIKTLSYGEKVQCYGFYTNHNGTIWLYVKDKTGQVGFCSKNYLK